MTFAPPPRLAVLLAVSVALALGTALRAADLVEIDSAGVIRWRADGREVALFGANYCLPSASDFRAAKRTGADLPKLIQQDFAHFARLGWDGVRLSFWGDWENSDRDGNLIANEHLDLLDRCLAEARRRGLYVLFSPITNHASWWPDSTEAAAPDGFSKFFEKSTLGTDPKAIAVQANYLRQILSHVNPHTGVALKDEPNLLFVELVNEPWHHSDDLAGSVAYINALTDAVRATGCTKPVFHNVSQDFAIAPAIRASRAQGVTFGWYPTALLNGRTLSANYLRTVDDYAPMRTPALRGLPSLVYEFDSADLAEATMIPAMTRTFRSVGAQFAAIFSWDMLATAPTNAGWQTHMLSLAYAPKKAVASAIAAEAMRRLPRGEDYGRYPANLRFGPFRVDPDANLAELVLPDVFMHAGDTMTAPPAPAKLARTVGVGSSPLVQYEGRGAYFLDRIAPATWRLEVHPDAVLVQDPFARKPDGKEIVSRLLARSWPMTVRLPDLGGEFNVRALGTSADADRPLPPATAGQFSVSPGVYLLSAGALGAAPLDVAPLPAAVGRVGLREFVSPVPPERAPEVVHAPQVFHAAGRPLDFSFEVLADELPAVVRLHLRGEKQPEARVTELRRTTGYTFVTQLRAGSLPPGAFRYHLTARLGGRELRFPTNGEWSSRVFPRDGTLVLIHGGSVPLDGLVATRGDGIDRDQLLAHEPVGPPSRIALRITAPARPGRHGDFTVAREIRELTRAAGPRLHDATALRVTYAAELAGRELLLSLVERDGTTWSAPLPANSLAGERELPLAAFRVGRGVQLPTGYPGSWNYWIEPADGRGGADDRVRLDQVEHVQISFRVPEGASASTPSVAPRAPAAPATTAVAKPPTEQLRLVSLEVVFPAPTAGGAALSQPSASAP